MATLWNPFSFVSSRSNGLDIPHYQPDSKRDWEAERKLFKATEKYAFFFSAAAGPFPEPVYQAYLTQLNKHRENADIGWLDTLAHVESGRVSLAKYFDVPSADQIGYCPSTSHGMNVIASLLKQDHPTGGEVLVCEDEFPASTVAWYHHGFHVKHVKTSDVLSGLTDQTVAVVCSQIQFSTGYRQDLVSLGKVLHEKNVPFIVNATQALGVFPASVKDAHITALTASCHKWLCGALGCSVLYVDPEFKKGKKWPFAGWLSVEDFSAMDNKEPSIKEEVSANEVGVPSLLTLVGVCAAIQHVERIGIDHIAQRVHELAKEFECMLHSLKDYIHVASPRDAAANFQDSHNSGILLLKIDKDPEEVSLELTKKNILVSPRRGHLRIAIHYFNNQDDMQRLIKALKEILPK